MAGDFPWLRSYLSCGLYPDCCLLAYALAFRAANEKTLTAGFTVAVEMGARNRKSHIKTETHA
jgi:hypothetical protein